MSGSAAIANKLSRLSKTVKSYSSKKKRSVIFMDELDDEYPKDMADRILLIPRTLPEKEWEAYCRAYYKNLSNVVTRSLPLKNSN